MEHPLQLQPQSWSAQGSLDTDLDRILATAADGSLPDSLPDGAGSLAHTSSFSGMSLEGPGSLERMSSLGSSCAGFRASQSSLPSPDFGQRWSQSSVSSPGAGHLNLYPSHPEESFEPPAPKSVSLAAMAQSIPVHRQTPVPDKAAAPTLVKITNTSCTLRWDALPGGAESGLWYHLYRVDEGDTEGNETTTLVYSTQDPVCLKFTCVQLEEGAEYHFGLVIESCDRMTQSALSDLLAVRVGLACTFAHLHSKGAGMKGKVNVQEKPYSRVSWVNMKQPPPPICERCTSTLRKHFKGQTFSAQLCQEFCAHVERVRCKKCQEWCSGEQCLIAGDFLCAVHGSVSSAQPVPVESKFAAARALPTAGSDATTTANVPQPTAPPTNFDDLGGLNGMMARTSIAEEEAELADSPMHGPELATETDAQMAQRLVQHKVEQLVRRLKEQNFGQLITAQYSDRTEQDHLVSDGFVSQPLKRMMVGKSFESVVTTELSDLMIVVFEHMRERVAQLPSFILPKWHAAYGTSTFEQLWELEHARSELVQEVISRENFGRNLLQAVRRAADTGELGKSHADMLGLPGFYDCWNSVLAQSGCVMVVYTCPRGSAGAAARVVASLSAHFRDVGVSAVAPIVSGQLGDVVYTGLAAHDHDCVFGGEIVPLEGATSVLERMIEEGYESEACEWITGNPSVVEWHNVESMSLLHKAAICGAHRVAVALLAHKLAESSVPLAQRLDVHGKSAIDYAALMDDEQLYDLLQDGLPACLECDSQSDSTKLMPDFQTARAAAKEDTLLVRRRGNSVAVSDVSDPDGEFSPYQNLLRGQANSILSEISSGATVSVGRSSLSTNDTALPTVVQTASVAAGLAAGAKVLRANIVECHTVTPGIAEGDRTNKKQHPYVEYRVVRPPDNKSMRVFYRSACFFTAATSTVAH